MVLQNRVNLIHAKYYEIRIKTTTIYLQECETAAGIFSDVVMVESFAIRSASKHKRESPLACSKPIARLHYEAAHLHM